jgi:pilus assembly protein CpaE
MWEYVTLGGETILVVDDEERVRDMIGTYLRDAGYRTVLAQDGTAALAAMNLRLPDLVLCDVNMPVMNGLQLALQLRSSARTASIPILMLSALGQPREVLSGYSAGADEYVTKPVELEVLLAKIESLLTRRPARSDAPPAGKLVAFLHAKGGVGTTTLAVNVAAALAGSMGPARVCLLDLNPPFCGATTFLGLTPHASLAEALAADRELRSQTLDQIMFAHGSGIRLVAGRRRADEELPSDVATIRLVLDRLRERFDYVLADAEVGLPPGVAAVAEAADLCCIVTSAGRASVDATRELLRQLDELPMAAERQVVVIDRLAAGLELGQVIQMLEREPGAIVTQSDLMATAADSGEPLVTTYRGHGVAAELEQLAVSLKRALEIQVGVRL